MEYTSLCLSDVNKQNNKRIDTITIHYTPTHSHYHNTLHTYTLTLSQYTTHQTVLHVRTIIIIIRMSVMELGHLLTRSGLTYPKSLQKSAMIPAASWGIVFHYPG